MREGAFKSRQTDPQFCCRKSWGPVTVNKLITMGVHMTEAATEKKRRIFVKVKLDLMHHSLDILKIGCGTIFYLDSRCPGALANVIA